MLRVSLLTAALLLAGCSTAAAPPPAPADFAVQLHYREGSVPPPDYYEYQITVNADNSALYRFSPGYPAPDQPVWQRGFRCDSAALYAALVDGGMLSTRWQQPEPPPIGGEQRWLLVRADGLLYELPPAVVAAQQSAAAALPALVEACLPAAIRAEIAAEHAAYQAAQP
jgi:hypothetical protein